jgi:hypothetical protein
MHHSQLHFVSDTTLQRYAHITAVVGRKKGIGVFVAPDRVLKENAVVSVYTGHLKSRASGDYSISMDLGHIH